jgi:cytochrome c
MRRLLVGCSVVAIGLISLRLGVVGAQEDPATPAFYTAKVKPILVTNCGDCHMGTNKKGGLVIDTQAGIKKGGRDGAVIVPGDPENSLFLKLIRHEGPPDDPMPMPPKKPKMSDADIAVITAWIKARAVMPPDPPPQ